MTNWKTKLLALPTVALLAGATALPSSAQCGYYSGCGFGNSFYTSSYPAIVGSTYVNPYGGYFGNDWGYYGNGLGWGGLGYGYGDLGYGYGDLGYGYGGLGYGLGGAALGAGVGALGGLAAGALFDSRHLGRDVGIGAGIGAGLGLLGGFGGWY